MSARLALPLPCPVCQTDIHCSFNSFNCSGWWLWYLYCCYTLPLSKYIIAFVLFIFLWFWLLESWSFCCYNQQLPIITFLILPSCDPNHCGHCGLLIATTNSCPPSLWSSWSCDLGHDCGLLVVAANSWPPLPLWSSWFFSLGYHYGFLVVGTNNYLSLPFWSLWSCSFSCHCLSF